MPPTPMIGTSVPTSARSLRISRYSVTPSRAYKQGDQWKESDRFDFEDLLPLAKLLDEAHSWILATEQAERKAA